MRILVRHLAAAVMALGIVRGAVAANARNAYVSVSCDAVSTIQASGCNFYVICPNDVAGQLGIYVRALRPYRLVAPNAAPTLISVGGVCSYRVSDENGTEDSFSGSIYVLKVEIDPAETNVCWKALRCTLSLAADSAPGGNVSWTSRPSGISGTGRSVSFSPQSLAPGEYAVSATSDFSSSCSDSCLVRVVKVELVTPGGDPVAAPSDSGDGQNEFTYSAASPGVLSMNLKARVTPSGATAAVASACVFGVGAVGDSVMSWASANPSGRAAASGDSLVASVTFTGLPASNSDFGRKTASIAFGGIICDEKGYEVFFPKEAKNHPLGQADSPNWFYYWKQGNVCSIPSDAKYEARPGVYGYWSRTNGLVLCDRAAQSSDGQFEVSADVYLTNLVFEIRHHPSFFADVKAGSAGVSGEAYFVETIVSDISMTKKRIKIGGIGKGIGCVAMTVKHELGHMDMNEIQVGSEEIVDLHIQSEDDKVATYGYDSLEAAVARMLKLERLFVYGDRDKLLGDGVPDGRERNGDGGVYSNDFDQDTFGLSRLISADYASYGDNEVRMRRLETEDFSDMYHEDLDWANPGCQHTNKFGPK